MAIVQLDILAHADFSGRLKSSKEAPGYGVFATAVERLRQENLEGTLLLDAGDEFSNPFWPGAPMVQAVSQMKTDAMTLGNHEFDRGEDFLCDCIARADFPVLCANIVRKTDGQIIPGTRPYAILERQGVKIGVLGITTEYTPYMVTASSFVPFQVLPCVETVKKYLPQMKQEGAQITVLLAHIPFYVGVDGSISGELVDILKDIPPVDVCMGGHIPGDYAGTYGNTLVMKGGFSGKSLCHATIHYDTVQKEIVSRSCQVHETDWRLAPMPSYLDYEQRVTAPFRDFFEAPLTYTEELWKIRLSHETKLGNLLAQCLQETADAQFAYANATCAGGEIQPGMVTAEDLTRIVGYNDPLYKAKITGRQIWELFELVYEPERYGNNAGLFHSGLVVHMDHTKPAGQKVQAIFLRDGTPLKMDETYTVATSEYMASGGNDTGKVAKQLQWSPVGTRVYDALIAYVKKHGCLHVSPEQRMIAIGHPENDNAPF